MPRTFNCKKASGWLLILLAVSGMVAGNFQITSAIWSIASDIGAMILLGVGMVMIAT